MNNTERIAEIEKRCEAATPGSWERRDTADYAEIHNTDSWGKALSPIAVVGYGEDADFIAHAREDIPYLLTLNAEKDKEIDRLTADRDKWQRLAEWRYEYIRSLGSKAEEGWSEVECLNHLLEQSTEHINKLAAELEQKTREVERYRKLEKDGRILPYSPDGEYGGEKIKAVARASNGNIIIETWAKDHLRDTFVRHILTLAEAEAALSAEGQSDV